MISCNRNYFSRILFIRRIKLRLIPEIRIVIIVYIPEMEKSYFLKVPLPDGEIDYRFAVSAMLDAGYQGYMAIEGCREGDQLYRDAKSVEYVKQLLKELGK